VDNASATPADQDAKSESKPDIMKVGSILADWPPMAQLGVRQTIKKHGSPQGVTPEAMIWTEVALRKSSRKWGARK